MKPRLQGIIVFRRVIMLALLAVASAAAADLPIRPLTVCEITADLAAHEGKDVAVLGRYSFRRDGRWIGEEACEPAAKTPPSLWLSEDSTTAPKPPGEFELDVPSLNRKFADLLHRTSLAKFRFGNPEYDRWAVIYGRVVPRKADAAHKASADLLFRGNGVVIFLTTEQ
uniref:SPOR domain-containing protein n=1 Tax=Solibacter usitatus (strain Ellin6076) TaxID=234267 RepID=Q01NM9_SOLUE